MDHDSWWIAVAFVFGPVPRTLSYATTWSMCHGSAVKMEIFILFNSHSLFNVPLPACLD